MSMDSIIEVFYHLNRMLIATKHILAHLVCNTVQTSQLEFF